MHSYQGKYTHLSPILKLLSLAALMIGFSILSLILFGVISFAFCDIELNSIETLKSNVTWLKTLQIIQSTALFILPGFASCYLLYQSKKEIFPGNTKVNYKLLVFPIIIMVCIQPIISWFGWLNHQISFPQAWQFINDWIIAKETEAQEMTFLLIEHHSLTELMVNVLMMVIIPAVGEEWIFRGLIQRNLAKIFNNRHIAILITAFLFSAMHFQFMGFLPRFLLGIVLGYLLIITNNLWFPIAAHFTNNLMAIIAYQYYSMDDVLNETQSAPDYYLVILSLCAILILFKILLKSQLKDGN